MMEGLLKILILEDSPDDLDLVERELKRGGIEFVSTVVKKKEEYEKALHSFFPDVILSDHSLPQFNSIEAMEIWKAFQKEKNVTIPFILITGSVSEEFAVQSIKAGAGDYILKDRLKRLPSSIRSALDKARLERERISYMSEVISQASLMKEAEHLANFGSWKIDLVTGKHQWSDEVFRMLGLNPGEVLPGFDVLLKRVHEEDKERLRYLLSGTANAENSQESEFRIVTKDGRVKNLHSRILVKRNDRNEPVQLLGFTLDITRQKLQTQALETQNQKLMEIAWVQSHEVRAPLARIMGLIQLIRRYPANDLDLNDTLGHIVNSANELDEIIRKIVRKTEEIV